MDRRVSQLLEQLNDSEPSERVAAARELFEHLKEPAVLKALNALRNDPNRALRTFVDNALTDRGYAAQVADGPDVFGLLGAFAKRLVTART